jgi:hypothetical protein
VRVGVGQEHGSNSSENHSGRMADGSGLLLTGDADLTDQTAVDRLVAHMTPNRIQTLGIFQVPHHGSKHNSSEYSSRKLAAPFNVFNANPHGRHGHPDSKIVNLFTSHKPAKGSIAPALALLANARSFEAVSVASDCALWPNFDSWFKDTPHW